MVDLIVWALQIYVIVVFAWIILSWIRVSPDHPVAKLSLVLDRLVYPVLLPLRRVVPPVRIGGAMLDLSPIVLLIGIQILIAILN